MELLDISYQAGRYTTLIANLMRCRFSTHTPVFLTHVVTDFCNQRCQFCDVWVVQKQKDIRNELKTEEVFRMLDQARDAGMVSYTIWGGEPLLRKDIEEILAYAHKKKFLISMITNGFLLEQKAEAVRKYVDHLILSIDAIGPLHDELRGIDGAYERALRGLAKVKDDVKVIINSVVTNRNIDEIDRLLDFAKANGAKSTFEPAQRISGFNEHLLLTKDQERQVFAQLLDRKRRDGLIANSYAYFETFSKQQAFTCHSPKMFVTVKADGTIYSCKGVSWGNVRSRTLADALQSADYTTFARESETCNRCVVSCVIETSKAYDLNPSYYYDMIKSLVF